VHTLQRNENECVVSLNDDLVNGQATWHKMVTKYLEMVIGNNVVNKITNFLVVVEGKRKTTRIFNQGVI